MNTLAKPSHPAEHKSPLRSGIRPPARRHFIANRHRHAHEGSETIHLDDGRSLTLRSIEPDDWQALQRLFKRLTPEEVRMRFLHPLNELSEPFAHELCNLDPATAFAWVITDADETTAPEIHAVARAYVDPVLQHAEFAIVVEGSYGKHGLGTLLMRRIIDSARKHGVVELWSDVFIENYAMLRLGDRLGFEHASVDRDPGIVRVTLQL